MGTNRIVYGLDTGSIEGVSQCVLVDVPADLDADELDTYLAVTPVTTRAVVAWEEVRDAAYEAMEMLGLDEKQRSYVVKQMADSQAHLAPSTGEQVEQALEKAVAIVFDGCHKIYIALDEATADDFRGYGYEEGMVLVEPGSKHSRDEAAAILREWWDMSCPLKFISTVRSTPDDPNEGFNDIIRQGEEWK